MWGKTVVNCWDIGHACSNCIAEEIRIGAEEVLDSGECIYSSNRADQFLLH